MNVIFGQCEGFDWKERSQGASKRRIIDVEDLSTVFDDGDKALSKTEAVKALQTLFKVGQSAAYDALKLDGRFSEHLSESGGGIKFKP